MIEVNIGYGVGGLVLGGSIVYYLFKHPELVQKWMGVFGWLLVGINKKWDYFATKNEIEGKINSYAGTLSAHAGTDYFGIRIKWAARDEKETIHWEDTEAILVMKDQGYRNKNFAHAAYFFTSAVLLKNTKQYLSKTQSESLDIYTTMKMLERENRQALKVFMEDFVNPLIQNGKIRELVKKLKSLDEAGLYFTVLVQELSYLGGKTFLSKPDGQIMAEVTRLIEFLIKRAERKVGEDQVADNFVGKYTRCSIRIVAKMITRVTDNVDHSVGRITSALDSGVENVYVMGPNEEGRDFITRVCRRVIELRPEAEIVIEKTLDHKINVGGKHVSARSFFVHIQNPNSRLLLIDDESLQKIEDQATEE